MASPQQLHLLPEDTLKVSRLNVPERRYLLKNMGQPKQIITDDPPGRPIEPYSMMVLLDRLRDEPSHVRTRISERIEASLEYEEKKQRRLEAFKTIDYANVGVGLGTGQTTEEQMFDVALSTQDAPTGEDWASDFRTAGAGPVIADSRIFKENLRIWCPWCEETMSGNRAMSGMGLHVYHKHRESKPEWDVVRKRIRAAWDKGMTFDSLQHQMGGDPARQPTPDTN